MLSQITTWFKNLLCTTGTWGGVPTCAPAAEVALWTRITLICCGQVCPFTERARWTRELVVGDRTIRAEVSYGKM